MASPSKWSLVLSCAIILLAALYYPRWEKSSTEATLSWDVSGYYFYLPALLIYKDVNQLQFGEKIIEKYHPSPQMDQAFLHESGNYVMKYPVGLAIQYLPWFYIGHYIANNSFYPADGFSYPYQVSIHWGSILISFIGLWFLRLILLRYYSERTIAVTLLCVAIGTNYLNYAAIDSAMPHNYLFTLYTLLIWLSIKFYESPSFEKSVFIGALIGLASITRPTEIITCLIPFFWGIEHFGNRFQFLKKHWKKLCLALVAFFIVTSIQAIYWKYTSGEWLVYSYQEQGFSWLSPHFKEGLLSYNSGWFIYTPLMMFSILGFLPLWRHNKSNFWFCLGYCLLVLYITFSWDIWWYGGGLGQRALIQSFPLFAIPLASFIQFSLQKSLRYLAFMLIVSVFIAYNFWLTDQAHRGDLIKTGQMTKSYFWHILGKQEIQTESLKLLDNTRLFKETPEFSELLFEETFESDTGAVCSFTIAGEHSICLSGDKQFSPEFRIMTNDIKADWLRVQAKYYTPSKEWQYWRMTQKVVRFLMGGKTIHEQMIRIQRLLNQGETKTVYIDIKAPDEFYDEIMVFYWNASSQKELVIDDLQIIPFRQATN